MPYLDVPPDSSITPCPPPVPRSFAVLLAVATGLTGYVLSPFLSSIFLGGVLAVTIHPAFKRLSRRLGGRELLSAAFVTALLFVVLVAPLAGIVVVAAAEITAGLVWIRDNVGVQSLVDIASWKLPEGVDQQLEKMLQGLHLTRGDLRVYVGQAMDYVQPITQKLIELSVSVTTQGIIVLFTFFVFVIDGYRLIELITDISPLRPEQTRELLAEFRNVSSAAIVGSVLTSVLKGIAIFAGFAATDIPHAVFFGIVTIFVNFIPIVGSMMVWAPAAIILILMSHTTAGLGLAAWSFITIFVVENVVKPIVLRGKVEMHGGLVLLALLGGLNVFGLVGLIAGPLSFALFLALLRMYRRDFARAQVAHPPPSLPV